MKHMLKTILWVSLISINVLIQTAHADEQSDRVTLRGMLASVEEAINDRDLSNVLALFLPDSVVVFQNKSVLIGPDEVQEFFEQMLGSSESILTDVKSVASIGAPASFHGPDTVVARGTLLDTYSFRGGSTMELDSVWTTTIIRLDGQWRIASLHFSANLFDNPVIDNTKRFILWAALGGLFFGLLLMWLFMRKRQKPS